MKFIHAIFLLLLSTSVSAQMASHTDRYAWTWQELRQALGWEEVMFILAIYFFPSMIAIGRKHHNRAAIVLLNLFLGWTALGWIASLVWSATAIQRVKENIN